jgi:hypothetical protein
LIRADALTRHAFDVGTREGMTIERSSQPMSLGFIQHLLSVSVREILHLLILRNSYRTGIEPIR